MLTRRLQVYDGWRGLLITWVVLGHICLETGFHIPILSAPGYAVDIFMLISGYFIQYNLQNLSSSQNNYKLVLKEFYKKRIIRIYPSYLISITIFLSILYIIKSQGKLPEEYNSILSLDNIIINLSLLNGFFPEYSNSIIIPTWSLSLEIQFYIIAPFIFFYSILNKYYYLIIISILCLLFTHLFGPQSENQYFILPSILPLRLMIFLVGMQLCNFKNIKKVNFFLLLFFISIINFKLLIIILIFYFVSINNNLNIFYKFLLISPLQNLGRLSYEIYLVHAPVILLYKITFDTSLSIIHNFLLMTLVTVPSAFFIALLILRIKL